MLIDTIVLTGSLNDDTQGSVDSYEFPADAELFLIEWSGFFIGSIGTAEAFFWLSRSDAAINQAQTSKSQVLSCIAGGALVATTSATGPISISKIVPVSLAFRQQARIFLGGRANALATMTAVAILHIRR